MSGSVLLRFLDTPIARKAFNAVQHFKVRLPGAFPVDFRDRWVVPGPGIFCPDLFRFRARQREDELDEEEQFALLRLHSWLGRTEKVDSQTIWLDDAQRAYLRSFTSKRIPDAPKAKVSRAAGG